MHYSGYRGQCIGRILYFLHHYAPYHIAAHCGIGIGEVMYGGCVFATFYFPNQTDDVPIFKFNDPPKGREYAMWDKEVCERNQREKLLTAIEHQGEAKKEPCVECRNLKLRLNIIQEFHPEWKEGAQ